MNIVKISEGNYSIKKLKLSPINTRNTMKSDSQFSKIFPASTNSIPCQTKFSTRLEILSILNNRKAERDSAVEMQRSIKQQVERKQKSDLH